MLMRCCPYVLFLLSVDALPSVVTCCPPHNGNQSTTTPMSALLMDCGCKREVRLIKVHSKPSCSKRMVSGYIPGLLFVSCEASAAAQVQPFRSDSAFLLLLCLLDDQDGIGGHGRVLVPVADTNATERNEGTWSGRLFLFARATSFHWGFVQYEAIVSGLQKRWRNLQTPGLSPKACSSRWASGDCSMETIQRPSA